MLNFASQGGFTPVKILAGERVFEMFAPQRTSIIFGITNEPWAAAAYRIEDLIVQLERNLNEWDLIAISASETAWLVRHNTVVYELQCTISPDIMGLSTNFFYRCPECNEHIYECTHLLISAQDLHQEPNADAVATDCAPTACPSCGGKIQSLGPGVSFCLDCDWEDGLSSQTISNPNS